jgi:hypothetical protein
MVCCIRSAAVFLAGFAVLSGAFAADAPLTFEETLRLAAGQSGSGE